MYEILEGHTFYGIVPTLVFTCYLSFCEKDQIVLVSLPEDSFG